MYIHIHTYLYLYIPKLHAMFEVGHVGYVIQKQSNQLDCNYWIVVIKAGCWQGHLPLVLSANQRLGLGRQGTS